MPMISIRRHHVVLLFIGGLFALTVLLWPRSRSITFPPLPQPNGYDALVRAGGILQRPEDSAKASSTEQLAELSAHNQKAFASLREALKTQCAVPVQMAENWYTVHGPEMVALKKAALALGAEAELQLRRGNTNGAILTYFDLMQLTSAIGKGGVLIDFLVSAACERIATERFPALIPGFDAAHCKEVAKFLQTHDEQRDSFEEIQKREDEWVRKSHGVTKRILIGIQERLNPNGGLAALAPNQANTYSSAVRAVRAAALLAAVRAYRLERGKAPDQISDLIPAYLSRVPIEPTTSHPLELPSSKL